MVALHVLLFAIIRTQPSSEITLMQWNRKRQCRRKSRATYATAQITGEETLKGRPEARFFQMNRLDVLKTKIRKYVTNQILYEVCGKFDRIKTGPIAVLIQLKDRDICIKLLTYTCKTFNAIVATSNTVASLALWLRRHSAFSQSWNSWRYIKIKIDTTDYVGDDTHHAKIGSN